MFGAAAMSLSSFCVVTNALRLNWFPIHSAKKDRKGKEAKKQTQLRAKNSAEMEETMEKTVKIEGMMCGHCEARVQKALEALPEVTSAKVSHEAGTAVVSLNASLSDDALKQAVEAQDYKVLDIK
jgi:Cu2+-exporting ATPase